MESWFDNDAFWDDLEPCLFNDEKWQQAPGEIDQVLALLDLPAGGAVVDMGCGPGRHSLELARRGFRVTGVDRTAKYLDTASEKARSESLDVEWVEADMREFRRPNAFDGAINLFTTFGFFQGSKEDRGVAAGLLSSLKPGGRLLMEMMGKEVLARNFQPREWREMPDGTLWLQDRTITNDWSCVDGRWIIIKNGHRREYRVDLRVYSAGELKALLTDVGFTSVSVFGSLEATPYDHQAQRLVVLARKPAN